MIWRLSISVFLFAFAFVACRKTKEALSNEKAISTFAFKVSDNVGVLTSDAIGVLVGDTIKVTVDAPLVSKLVASVNFVGKSISPSLDSGVNFMDPVVYTVTANDGSIKQFTVIVNTTSTLYAVGQTEADRFKSYLYALDAVTGKLKWKFALETWEATNPTIANGVVYVGVLGGIIALDATTGEVKWRRGAGPRRNTNPQVADNLVHMFSGGEWVRIYAFDAATGTGGVRDRLDATDGFITVTVGEGKLVSGHWRGMHCWDALTGVKQWTSPYVGGMFDNPAVVNGSIYNGSNTYKIVALDLTTGQKKWGVPSADSSIDNGTGTSPTLHQGVLYQGGSALNAYDTATGAERWEYRPATGAIFNPVGENGVIYATGSGDAVYAINSNGILEWQYGIAEAVDVRPFQGLSPPKNASAVVANGVVYTGSTRNNKLIALDAATGHLLWSYEGLAPFWLGPCLMDSKGNVFHAGTSGAQQ